MRRFVRAVLVASLTLSVAAPLPAGANREARQNGTAPALDSIARAAVDVTASRRIVIEAGPDRVITLEGRYRQRPGVCAAKQRRPLRAKYRGTLTITRTGDGRLRVVDALGFPRYLAGLAEVPRSWPEQALRAQVIAARTYAIAALRRNRGGAWDICATDACQVYRGAVIELGAFGERWVDAVNATAGRIITYGGRPISAFYFSTSTGRTRDHFPGGSPTGYLRRTTGEDADSPLARWRARLPLGDLATILRAFGSWPGGRISSVALDGSTVVVRGGGRVVRLSKDRFRIALNNEAPCRFPGTYPGNGSAIGTRLPQTVPSSTFVIEKDGRAIVVRGRGWGHGVGMSQYGARSLAARGRSARQIIDHFYRNVRVSRANEPSRIRVLAADGLQSIRLSVGAKAVVRADGSRVRPGRSFAILGGDSMRLRSGIGPSLPATLTIKAAPARARVGDGNARLRFTLSAPARVRATIRDARKREAGTAEETSFESGKHRLKVPVPAVGRYAVELSAYDGYDRVRAAAALVVEAPVSPAPVSPGKRPRGKGGWIALAAVAAAAALAGLLGVRRARRRPASEVGADAPT